MKAKTLCVVLLSALLIWGLPTGTPVNNSETKVAHTAKAEQPVQTTEKADVTVAAVEEPAAPQPESQPEPVAIPEQPPIPTTRTELMAAAGISPEDYGAADYIISHESSWRHDVHNGGGSGAYGLCQSLPASKMASAGEDYMTNPVTQLRWCHEYATKRYGSWSKAQAFWQASHWW